MSDSQIVLTAIEIDCVTGVQIERPLTAEEIASQQAAQEEAAQAAQEKAQADQTKAANLSAAQSKLAALGLTSDEISEIIPPA